MSKKGSRSSSARVAKPKKRPVPQNRYVLENDTSCASASAQKLGNKRSLTVPIDPNFGYSILEFNSVFSAISESVVCKNCNGKIEFLRNNKRGAGFKLVLTCDCEKEKTIRSGPMINNAYEVNRRFSFYVC